MATIFLGIESMGWLLPWQGWLRQWLGRGVCWAVQESPSGRAACLSTTRLRILRGCLALVLSLGLGLGNPTPAWGEAGSLPLEEPTSSGGPEVTVGTIPSEKVTQFVTAYLQVVALIDARSEELEAAPTEAESLALQQAIQAAAYGVIEATGLTRQEYWQLLGLANSDMEFRDRVLAQLEESP